MIPYIQINIPTYELMVVIGILGSISFLRLRNRNYGYTKQQLIPLFVSMLLGMAIGSRLLYFATALPTLVKEGLSVQNVAKHLLSGGFVFYGGLFGALAGLAVCCKRKAWNLQQVFNFVVPGITLFHMFGRIGCFLAGCCYGIEVPWGIPYLGTRRFPVQLLEALSEFILTVWLLTYEDKVKLRAKPVQTEEKEETTETLSYSLLERYLCVYAVIRILLEFLRGDEARGYWGVLSTSQWISMVLLVVLAINRWRKKRRGNQ